MSKDNLLLAVNKYVINACAPLDRQRYGQEPAYVSALLGRLEGSIDLSHYDLKGNILFRLTVIADRGPNSAEKKYGADFALVFRREGMNDEPNIEKAIIAQAKNGNIDNLSKSDRAFLEGQCLKMSKVTNSYIVLEVPLENEIIPFIRIVHKNAKNEIIFEARMQLDEYLVKEVIACKHGDKDKKFINAVGNSKLPLLDISLNG